MGLVGIQFVFFWNKKFILKNDANPIMAKYSEHPNF